MEPKNQCECVDKDYVDNCHGEILDLAGSGALT